MTTSIAEETGTAPATATGDQPKPNKKAHVAPRRAHVAPKKAKSARKATPAKKASKGREKDSVARAGTKTAKVLALLKRPGGATLKDLMKGTGWQAHSVRGFISILGSKGVEQIESAKNTAGERFYKIAK